MKLKNLLLFLFIILLPIGILTGLYSDTWYFKGDVICWVVASVIIRLLILVIETLNKEMVRQFKFLSDCLLVISFFKATDEFIGNPCNLGINEIIMACVLYLRACYLIIKGK